MGHNFNIGDVVISKSDHLLGKEIIKGKEYIINGLNYNERAKETMVSVDGAYGFFSKKLFKLSKLYYRKKKINKILNGD